MKKESKNLGIAKACPDCKKTIIKSANFSGTGSFSLKCPHCKALVVIQVNPQTTMTLTKVFSGIKIKGIKIIGVESE